MKVDVQIDDSFQEKISAQLVRDAALETLRHQAASEMSALTIAVTGDGPIRKLNAMYMGIDAPTDVLSFPADNSIEIGGEVEKYQGDIMISFDRAMKQAADGGHSLQEEIQLLTVHGVLHLIGHDHYEADEKEAMWKSQSEILKKLGNPLKPA